MASSSDNHVSFKRPTSIPFISRQESIDIVHSIITEELNNKGYKFSPMRRDDTTENSTLEMIYQGFVETDGGSNSQTPTLGVLSPSNHLAHFSPFVVPRNKADSLKAQNYSVGKGSDENGDFPLPSLSTTTTLKSFSISSVSIPTTQEFGSASSPQHSCHSAAAVTSADSLGEPHTSAGGKRRRLSNNSFSQDPTIVSSKSTCSSSETKHSPSRVSSGKRKPRVPIRAVIANLERDEAALRERTEGLEQLEIQVDYQLHSARSFLERTRQNSLL